MKLTDVTRSMGECVVMLDFETAAANLRLGSVAGATATAVIVHFADTRRHEVVLPHDLLFYFEPLLPQLVEWVKEAGFKNAAHEPE